MSSAVLYVRVPRDLHDAIATAADRDGLSIARWVSAVLADAMKANPRVRVVFGTATAEEQ